MKRTGIIILTVVYCLTLFGCGRKEPNIQNTEHQHIFGEWTLQQAASCKAEGREDRHCSECDFTESRAIPRAAHQLNDKNICKNCWYVEFDTDAELVELGIVCDAWYGTGNVANYAGDVKVWDGKVYRAAGDYNENSGSTIILAYNIATQTWETTGTASDEAIHRFVEIGGTLYTPGIDSTGDWDTGNFYVLGEDGKWQLTSNLPNGLHCFDMIQHSGRIFAGLGTEVTGNTVAVSEDGGKNFSFVSLYRDGTLLDTSGYEYSRTYEFVEYDGKLYAMVSFKKKDALSYDKFIFRYEDGKMVYQSVADILLRGKTGRNYWQGKLVWNGVCYLTAMELNAVTDFSKSETHKKITMPNNGTVSDAVLYGDELYVLSFTANEDMTYKTAIYKSATGEEGSFTEVVRYDYPGIPISFDFDGDHFYIGIGNGVTDQSKTGMILRVKPTV